MKIQYASDLHLEFRANREWLRENPLEVTGDILLLAGDIITFTTNPIIDENFWLWCSNNYKKVLVVPGNHEYYRAKLFNLGEDIQWNVMPNVGYYDNKVIRIEDTDFILSTLWSHISSRNGYAIGQSMNDFYEIEYKGKLLTNKDYNMLHEKSVRFIEKAVKESTAQHIVVVTHHSPSLLTIATEHLTSPLWSAFATDLHCLMEDGKIDYWVYGHSHTNINCKVLNTEVVCNQLGYVEHRGQMAGFRLDKYFEL